MPGYDEDIFGRGGLSYDPDVFAPSQVAKEALRSKIAAQIASDPISQGAQNPAADMSWLDRRRAQLGSGFNDAYLGVKGLFSSSQPQSLSDIVSGDSPDARVRKEVDEARRLNSKLNTDLTGKALNFAGNVLPSLAVPGGWAGAAGRAAPVVEGLLTGGALGAASPTGTGESRGVNTAVGAVGGAALPAVFSALRAGTGAKEGVTALADRYGIPVGLADASTNPLVQATRSVLNDVPMIGAIGRAQKDAQQGAFNAAVGNTFGAPERSLTPQVMDAARGKIGGELDRLWNGNAVKVDQQLAQALQLRRVEAAKLPQGDRERVLSWLDDIASKIDPSTGTIPGDVANRFQSKLGQQASKGGFVGDDLGSIRKELIGAFNRSVTGADADALTAARTQYKNFKTVQPLMDKAAVATGGREAGDVPAGLLSEAVRQSFKGLGSRSQQPQLADLAQVGSRLIADRTPQTGGSARALVQNSALGTGLAYGGMTNPLAAAVVPPVMGATNWALGNNAVRKLLTTTNQRGLLDAPELTPAMLELMRKGLLQSPAYGGLGLLAGSAPLE